MYQLSQWHPNYSVFVKELDDQHKVLIDMINQIYNAYLQNLNKEKVLEIITKMSEYAALHFANEEKYFEKFGYEDAEKHISEHTNFLKKAAAFQSDYKQNKILLSLQVINFLQEWLNKHMLGTDKKYVSCFQNGGLK